MASMRRRHVLTLALTAAATTLARRLGARPARAEPLPGAPAPAAVVAEIEQALGGAVRRFEARDAPGVLAYVSEQYRTGPLTKPVLADELAALFSVHDQVKAMVRVDAVRLVGDHAWIYSTGNVNGRVRFVGTSVPVLSWQRQLEVARRENGRWRLYGYQQ